MSEPIFEESVRAETERRARSISTRIDELCKEFLDELDDDEEENSAVHRLREQIGGQS